jgi:branched-chain amino acid transport system ATP-binding protein
MSGPLLEVRALTKRFGGFTALREVSLDIRAGERIGILGPNGSGKSTLVNCITGLLRTDSGDVLMDGESLSGAPAHVRTRRGIARTFQIPKPFNSISVAENIRVPLDYVRGSDNATDHLEQASRLLSLVGLDDQASGYPSTLTQVELRKLELAKAIASQPKLLIADEALAGLSTAEVDEILGLLFKLNDQGIAIVMIEHIMRAVTKFSQRVIVLVAGQKIADGPTNEVMRDPKVEQAYLGE